MFEYKIYKSVYDDIICGKKTIEYRLLNEKSEKIKKGDTIIFKVLDSDLKLVVEVTNKYIYDSVDELWAHTEVLTNALELTKEELKKNYIKYLAKNKY